LREVAGQFDNLPKETLAFICSHDQPHEGAVTGFFQ
jgi:hypothetical protein